ncbi:MAG: GNAT family N-acetyltransferase [Actinobacteria bacterium]|nr:GNAT family N-acetyltransferase [Actinomycetota bacterium]
MFDRRRLLDQVLVSATAGHPIAYQRLLWDDGALSEPVPIPSPRYLIVEGIATYAGELEQYYDLRVWIDVPLDVASGRGRAHDGLNENAGLWVLWRADDIVETARLTLRRFTADDVDDLVALDSDPEVMFFVTGGLPTPRAEIEDVILPCWLEYQETSRVVGFWAALDAASGEFLGWFHLRPRDGAPPDELELGYRLRRAVWGRGLATEGSRALIGLAFTATGASRVVAETMVAHAASRRVMEKCGMTPVRVFQADWPYRIPGDELGDVEYSLRREDWVSTVPPDAPRESGEAVESRGHPSPPASV